MGSNHDTRSVRASKRMSVTALYLSMSAKDKDLEISDDLAKGTCETFHKNLSQEKQTN
jgi:hypothetical protein